MAFTFGVVDLFAGPGGLGEGFASFLKDGRNPFRIGISVEKEASAHRTLTLRAFLREYRRHHDRLPNQFVDFHAGLIPEPNWSTVDPIAWRLAIKEARALELGTSSATNALNRSISELKKQYDETILIGGPPCQAYSLVGRARSKGNVDYVPEDDARHYLFREYIRVLDKLRPAAFVMENVKGMLSSTVASRLVFEMLMEDLSSLGTGRSNHYELRAIRVDNGRASLASVSKLSDFIVRSEAFGIPQRRHRVIIVGIRSDIARKANRLEALLLGRARTVGDVIRTMPALRSGISQSFDDETIWKNEVIKAAKLLAATYKGKTQSTIRGAFLAVAAELKDRSPTLRAASWLPDGYGTSNDELLRWIERLA